MLQKLQSIGRTNVCFEQLLSRLTPQCWKTISSNFKVASKLSSSSIVYQNGLSQMNLFFTIHTIYHNLRSATKISINLFLSWILKCGAFTRLNVFRGVEFKSCFELSRHAILAQFMVFRTSRSTFGPMNQQ